MKAEILSASLAFATVLGSAEASAFCRATTTNDDGPLDANGCSATGKPLYWKERCIGYRISEDASAEIDLGSASAVFARAFANWDSASCTGSSLPSVQFFDLGPTSETAVEYNEAGPTVNVNLVVFRDANWPHQQGATDLDDVALTTVTYDASSGQIKDADIELNTALYELSTSDPAAVGEYDLSSIAAHQVGHFLGFAHSSVAGATMAATLDPGSVELRDLSPDDVAAVCETYRPDGKRVTAEGLVDADTCNIGLVSGAACPSSTVAGCSTAPKNASDTDAEHCFLLGLGLTLVLAGSRRRRENAWPAKDDPTERS